MILKNWYFAHPVPFPEPNHIKSDPTEGGVTENKIPAHTNCLRVNRVIKKVQPNSFGRRLLNARIRLGQLSSPHTAQGPHTQLTQISPQPACVQPGRSKSKILLGSAQAGSPAGRNFRSPCTASHQLASARRGRTWLQITINRLVIRYG